MAGALPIAVLIAAVLGAFHRVVGPARGLFFRDHLLVFRPLWWSAWIQLQSGHWPVLNIEHPSGMPLESSVATALYTPATLLMLLPDFDLGYDWMVAFHYLALAIGTYLFARRLSAAPESAAIAALIAALCGPVFSCENLLVALTALAYTPWVGWALVGIMERPSLDRIAALALALAFQLQGVMPEIVLLDVTLFAGLFHLLRPKISIRLALALGAAAALSLLLAAADLGPLFEELAGSRRLGGFSDEERSGWSLHSLQLVELIAPAFWSPPDLVFFNVPAATGSSSDPPYFMTLYFGAALPLALAAPWWRHRSLRWIAIAVVVSFLVAAGDGTPLHRLLSGLPLFRSGRYAIKYLLFAGAGIAVLAAFTVARIEARARAVAVSALVLAGIGVTLLLTSTMPEAHALLARNAAPFRNGVPFQLFANTDVVALGLGEMQARLWHGIIANVALAGAALWVSRRPGQQAALQKLMVLIIAIDLAAAAAHALPSAPVADVHLPAQVVELIGGRRHRVLTPDPPAVPLLGRSPFEAYLAHRARYGRDVVGEIRRFESLDVDAQNTTAWDEVVNTVPAMPWPRAREVLAEAGVRYYLSSSPPSDPVALTYPDLEGKPIYVAEIREARPYVYVSTSSACPGRAEIDERASSFDLRVMHVDASCSSTLLLQELMRARWEASVDGKPLALAPGRMGSLTVQVPAGSHRVELRYRPASRRWWPVSIAGVLIWLALQTISRRDKIKLARQTKAEA